MNIILKEGYDTTNNVLEFYLVGLENFEDFDVVFNVLKHKKQVKILEVIEGIYSRTLKFDIESNHYVLVFHEDVGIYSYSTQQSDELNNLLRNFLQQVVNSIQSEFP